MALQSAMFSRPWGRPTSPPIMSRPERVRAGGDVTERVVLKVAMGAQRSTTGSAKPRNLRSGWRTGTVFPQIQLSQIVQELIRYRRLPSNNNNSSSNRSSNRSSNVASNSNSNRSLLEQAPQRIRQLSWPARTAVPPSLRFGAGMRAVIPFAMLAVSPISALELLIRSYDGRWLYPTLAAVLPIDHLI